MEEDWGKSRNKIIGLGEQSARKSYYPELQEKMEALEASQNNLQTIINSISDGIVIHNFNGEILSLNKPAEKIYNISEEERCSYTIIEISSPQMDIAILQQAWIDTLLGNPQTIEWTISQAKTKIEIVVQMSINKTIWNSKPALVAVIRDFSERKKYEEELIIARKKAEESDKLKSAFLANLSHEIRTPMNAILGFTDLLNDPDLTPDMSSEYISIIRNSGDYLLSIINDIIEMSKIETGLITLNCSWINLDVCIQNLYDILKINIPKELDIELKIIPSESKNLWIKSDETKLSQVINNLVNNAIKYTKTGYIAFGYKLKSDDEIEFIVVDTGIGIEKKYHDVIFDRFTRVENDLAINIGGTGLGLSICKAYVELLGGSIRFESEIDRGSVFSFSIPLTEYKTVI